MTFRSNDRRSACSGGRPSLKKIISSSKTRYTIHREGQEAVRAVDKRAGELNAEYLAKAKHTDQTYCGTPRDTVGPVELKLGSLGRVHGIVVGQVRTEEAQIALTISLLRKSLSVWAVCSQAKLHLGRLDVLGPGAAVAPLGGTMLSISKEGGLNRGGRTWTLQGRSILCILCGK